MRFLLYTNACIDHLRRGPQSFLTARLRIEPVGNVCLCSVVRAELIYGAFRSNDPITGAQRVKDFFAGLASLPFDDRAADVCGELRSCLAGLGTPIGPNDLMIASIARANGLTVVTNNVREFSRVPGLAVENWSHP